MPDFVVRFMHCDFTVYRIALGSENAPVDVFSA
jgi:hypothetical protein